MESIFKLCSKEKSPGPDGWPVEFYLGIWDLIGEELCQLVEETRCQGFISGAMNSTFIALIPKVTKPSSFDDFHPISLCNFIYKLIPKIIAERLKPFLANCISSEQFGFLHHRLSRLISFHKTAGQIRGVRVTTETSLTHVLFVDDVLLFGGNSVDEWKCFSDLLSLFCNATGMEISLTKSSLIAHKGVIDQRICDIFPLPVSTLEA